jgi:SOS-response transcriptional repressor LexA
MNIKQLILEKINKNHKVSTSEITTITGFSRAYINRFIQELVNEHKIILIGKANQAHYIKYSKNVPKEIKKVEKNKNKNLLQNFLKVFDIPIMGMADCGEPLSIADDYIEDYMQVSSGFIKGRKEDYFFVRAHGDSMNKENIKDKNLVLIKKDNSEPRNGDKVLAIVNGCGTIKKFLKRADAIYLCPNSTNPKHKPIVLHFSDEIFIAGKVNHVFDLI